MQVSLAPLTPSSATSSPAKVYPVARIRAYFRLPNATAERSTPCSGFAVTGKDYVVTSAHAITGHGRGAPTRVQIQFRSDPGPWTVWGTRVAWPTDWLQSGLDVALVQLERVPELLEPSRFAHVPDGGTFSGRIRSISNEVRVSGTRRGAWLDYDGVYNLVGYSGGPVQAHGSPDVFGVHAGRRHGSWGACACSSLVIGPLESRLKQ
jgi:hypothetical protein